MDQTPNVQQNSSAKSRPVLIVSFVMGFLGFLSLVFLTCFIIYLKMAAEAQGSLSGGNYLEAGILILFIGSVALLMSFVLGVLAVVFGMAASKINQDQNANKKFSRVAVIIGWFDTLAPILVILTLFLMAKH